MGASSYQDEIKTDDIQAWFKDAWQNDRDYYGSNPYPLRHWAASAFPFPEERLAVKANGSYIVAGWLAE